jgi:LmbE family N-acetylglucosaminyl deacetylase
VNASSFAQIFTRSERPLLVLAHPHDELACSGILQRLRDRIRVVFMTNGDGPARTENLDPVRYAAIRKAEALESLGTSGVAASQARFFGYSEDEIYRNMARLKKSALRLSEVVAFFEPIRRSMAEAAYEFRPDVAFAVGFHGGHPEHGLAHFFGALAVRNFAREVEANIPLYQFPEYVLTTLLPERLRTGYPGEKYWILLDGRELETKKRMADCYLSRRPDFKRFRRIAGILNLPQAAVRRQNPADRFFGREQVSLVPGDFDYRRVPYRPGFLDHLLEDFEGTPITFQGCLRPIVVAFEENAAAQRN